MRSNLLRVAFFALMMIGSGFYSAAQADNGAVRFRVVKAGWFIGASGGSGVLVFHGRSHAISIGGLSAGLVFGAAATDFRGTASHMRTASDIAGVYTAIGAGAAVGPGVRGLRLRNEKGVLLVLRGVQAGLMLNADLSGMSISIR